MGGHSGKRSNSNSALSNPQKKVGPSRVVPINPGMDPADSLDKDDPLEAKLLDIIDFLKKKVTIRSSSFSTDDLNYVVRFVMDAHAIRVGEKFAENRLVKCLESKLAESKNESSEIMDSVASAIQCSTDRIESSIQKLHSTAAAAVLAPAPTFASVARKAPPPKSAARTAMIQAPNRKTVAQKTTISLSIKPIDPLVTPVNTIEGLLLGINPAEHSIKSVGMHSTKDAVIIKLGDKESADKLQNMVTTHPTLGSILSAQPEVPLQPTVVIHFISKFIKKEDVLSMIIENHPCLSDDAANFKLLYSSIAPNAKTQSVYYRVTPSVLTKLRGLNMKLAIGYSICRVQLKFMVRQCQKCFAFDHVSGSCPLRETHSFCKTCAIAIPSGTNHVCSQVLCCKNCSGSRLAQYNNNTGHKVNKMECPLYAKQQNYMIENTDTNGSRS